eukprot:TRINITY_DN53026_c0_g2_i2.p1 TRINITY_DN53026_c0_g2~~TRINITY_DN53026_c0_g2_i2.p1  ORF type:complete len:131 (+),score=3.14 TRINITY_DN53026_c0_g2_i2:629-1021(+)
MAAVSSPPFSGGLAGGTIASSLANCHRYPTYAFSASNQSLNISFACRLMLAVYFQVERIQGVGGLAHRCGSLCLCAAWLGCFELESMAGGGISEEDRISLFICWLPSRQKWLLFSSFLAEHGRAATRQQT